MSSAGSPKKCVGALLLEHQQAALDRADRDGGDVAVLGHERLAALADVVGHGAQVLEVEQRHVLVGRHPEHDVEHALLRLVELEQAGEQQRPHVLHGGAHGMALLAEHVPEHGRVGGVGPVVEADLLGALGEPVLLDARLGDAGEVALDVGGEHRHAGIREAFGQHLQRYRLAGAGGAGDEAVAVGELELQVLRLDAAAEEDLALLHQALRFRHGALLTRGNSDAPLLNYMSASVVGNAGVPAYRAKNKANSLPSRLWLSAARGDAVTTVPAGDSSAFHHHAESADVPLRPIRRR